MSSLQLFLQNPGLTLSYVEPAAIYLYVDAALVDFKADHRFRLRTLADAVTLEDAVAFAVVYNRSFADVAQVLDASAFSVVSTRTDDVSVVDDFDFQFTAARVDTVTVSDATAIDVSTGFTDLVSFLEDLIILLATEQLLDDAVSVGDTLGPLATTKALIDAVSVQESLFFSGVFSVVFTDNVSVAESLSYSIYYGQGSLPNTGLVGGFVLNE